MSIAVRIENFSFAWPGTQDWALRGISLDIPQGECHCLTGATGAGKSTLSLALKDLLPQGRREGRLLFPNGSGGEGVAVGLVMQNPETQILTETVGAEVAFGLEGLCLPPEEMPARVEKALEKVGLGLPLDHPTGRLSMGQKYRVLVAAQLVLEPKLLILDEPGGQLDQEGLRNLAEIIHRLKERGTAVLLCEHNPGPLEKVIDRSWHLTAGGPLGAHQVCRSLHATGSRPAGKVRSFPAPPVVEVRDLEVAVEDATPAWRQASLVLREGERVLLCGPNGAGKTTLFRCLAGLLKPLRGEILVCGAPPTPEHLRGRVGYLFQNPRRQLFETNIFDEVAFGLKRLGIARRSLAGKVNRSLEVCGIGELAESSPHRLSYGQQHLVALASVLASEPDLLLLDDPLAGLDPGASKAVCGALVRASEEWGTTVFWTSHRLPPDHGWNHRILGIEGGRLADCGSDAAA